MELPQWNCRSGTAPVELPQWDCPQWNRHGRTELVTRKTRIIARRIGAGIAAAGIIRPGITATEIAFLGT